MDQIKKAAREDYATKYGKDALQKMDDAIHYRTENYGAGTIFFRVNPDRTETQLSREEYEAERWGKTD